MFLLFYRAWIVNLKLGDIVYIVQHSQAALLFVKFEEARRGGVVKTKCRDEWNVLRVRSSGVGRRGMCN